MKIIITLICLLLIIIQIIEQIGLLREIVKINNSQKKKRINIKYFDDEIDKIECIDNGDWIDLRSAQKIELKKGNTQLIPLGVAMQLPEGYEAHIVPRSSTFKNFKIIQTNHMGVVDESYCGDNDQWMMPVMALEDTVIHKNDRICQFRIVRHQPQIIFDEVNNLTDNNRGGFGSTGTR